MPLNKEVITQWVAALRSGDYQQGRGVLCRSYDDQPDQFCCWGVLCDLFAKEHPRSRWEDNAITGVSAFVTPAQRRSVHAPADVVEWAGIQFVSDANRNTVFVDLAGVNDEGRPFPWIADLIESELNGVFDA